MTRPTPAPDVSCSLGEESPDNAVLTQVAEIRNSSSLASCVFVENAKLQRRGRDPVLVSVTTLFDTGVFAIHIGGAILLICHDKKKNKLKEKNELHFSAYAVA